MASKSIDAELLVARSFWATYYSLSSGNEVL